MALRSLKKKKKKKKKRRRRRRRRRKMMMMIILLFGVNLLAQHLYGKLEKLHWNIKNNTSGKQPSTKRKKRQ